MDWLEYENKAYEQGFNIVCGVDEAGRGPLAGDVYAAAVILPKGYVVEGVNDSKKLSEKKREALFDKIVDECICYSVGTASVEEIDEINILQATFLAMKRAVDGLEVKPQIAEKYPEYQFEKHKGYGTKLHYEMLDKYGISDVHRKTFLKKYMDKKNEQ